MPPVNFKKHAHRFIPPAEAPPTPAQEGGETRVDIFGKQVPVLKNNRREPFMWKLSYRLNNPEYEKVQELKAARQSAGQIERQHPPATIHPSPIVPEMTARRSQVH